MDVQKYTPNFIHKWKATTSHLIKTSLPNNMFIFTTRIMFIFTTRIIAPHITPPSYAALLSHSTFHNKGRNL